MGTPDIKVITGVRRAGKSTLLHDFASYIHQEQPHVNLILVDLNNLEQEHLREYHALHHYITERHVDSVPNIVLIDEVQMCSQFELAINSLHNSRQYDLYITGSNNFLLGSDLVTLFSGRTYSLEVSPFSFREYLDYFPQENHYAAFRQYLQDGGFAGSYNYTDVVRKNRYLAEVFDTIVVRDIQDKHHLKNTSLLSPLIDFMADNISRQMSARSLAVSLSQQGEVVSPNTVSNYLDYLIDVFVLRRLHRYDIQGKKYLASQEKYYLIDHALRGAHLGHKNADYSSIFENIVAIELLRRGWEVYVGTLRHCEIDFVAQRQDEKIYIQVSYSIDVPETFAREVRSLLSLKNAYPKYLITSTYRPEYSHEGIHVIDIADWLLAPDRAC